MSSNTARVTDPISIGFIVNLTPSVFSRSYSFCTLSTPNIVKGMLSLTRDSLRAFIAG